MSAKQNRRKNKEFTWSLSNCNSGDTDLGKTERVLQRREAVAMTVAKAIRATRWSELSSKNCDWP